MLSWILTALAVGAVLCAAAAGNTEAAGRAVLEGAEEALRFAVSVTGPLCLWSGALGLLERCGGAARLSRLLRPLLGRLFPCAARDAETFAALTENVSANLLGLGNAATPAGLRAMKGLARLGERARDELCLLVVLNTASLQLLPTAIASVRSAAGAAAPFDILPATLLSSALSVTAGLLAAALLRRVWP